jgi:hypothetical protein
VILNAGELSAGVDVTLDNVTAESRGWRHGTLEIHRRSRSQPSERGAQQRLAGHVGAKRIVSNIERSQTNAIHGDRVAVIRAFRDHASMDDKTSILAPFFYAAHAAEFFNDSGEHNKTATDSHSEHGLSLSVFIRIIRG